MTPLVHTCLCPRWLCDSLSWPVTFQNPAVVNILVWSLGMENSIPSSFQTIFFVQQNKHCFISKVLIIIKYQKCHFCFYCSEYKEDCDICQKQGNCWFSKTEVSQSIFRLLFCTILLEVISNNTNYYIYFLFYACILKESLYLNLKAHMHASYLLILQTAYIVSFILANNCNKTTVSS